MSMSVVFSYIDPLDLAVVVYLVGLVSTKLVDVACSPKSTLKRLAAPRPWMLDKLSGTYVCSAYSYSTKFHQFIFIFIFLRLCILCQAHISSTDLFPLTPSSATD